MSSPANNSLPSVQATPSAAMNVGANKHQQRPPRSSSDQANQPGSSQRHRRGRNERPAYRGPNNRPANNKDLQDNQAPAAEVPTAPEAGTSLENPDPGIASQVGSQSSNELDASKSIGSSKHKSGQKGPRGPGTGGKYKQRHQMSQLIDGLDGLDIDLVETIAPTNRPYDSTKGRHATVSRKVNFTHFLNQHRRQRGERHYGPYNDDRNQRYSRQTYYRDCNNTHKFNKQQFLQANCQFVVLPFHDYSIHMVDPDWPVDWNCIEEVKFRQTGTTETTCPICLDPPVSAKITRCGHIYCWTCMLHYLSLCDEKDRQCPICFEPILESDLRSVVSCLYSNHAVDEEITMRLMFRRKGCVEIEPYSRSDHMHNPIDVVRAENYGSQANLLIVSPSTVIKQVARREEAELLFKLETDRDEPEVCFVEQALVKLKKRIERLEQLALEAPEMSENLPKPAHPPEPSTSQREEKSFLFYQSADGQHIYLNPFSTKILCHEYGGLEDCPLEIRAKVLQMDWISMSETWRKRFKYLEHLPLTCEFRLIEIDFETSGLVSKDTFASYENQIKTRANERAFRRTEEMKRDKIIQIEQNRKIYGIQPTLTIELDNEEQFPSVCEDARIGPATAQNQVEGSEGAGNSGLTATADSEEVSEADTFPSGATLSFKEIQERQEAAEAAKSGCPRVKPSKWANSKAVSAKNAPPSSFAKLLEDAKSSSKQWTRTTAPTAPKQVVSQSGSTQQRQQMASGAPVDPDDDGCEELRAPPCRFTIGDLLASERTGKKSRKNG